MVELEKLFAQRHPEAGLEVQYLQPAKVYAAVLADQADLGLVSYPHATREIKVIPWRQEEMVLATAPDHPLAKRAAAIRGAIPVEDLNGVDFVGFDEELPIRGDVDRFLKEKGVEVNVSVHFDNIEMVKEAVAHRVGVSIMPHRVMREDIRQKRLTAIRIAGASLVPAPRDHPSQEEAFSAGGAGVSGFAVRKAGAGGGVTWLALVLRWMRDDLFDEVGIVRNREVKTPILVHPSLPEIPALVELFGAEGRMCKVLFQEPGLFVKSPPDSRRSGLQR